MFHHQKNPIRRLHVAAQTKKNELLYLTKSRYKFLMVHVCSFRISWHLFKNSDTQGLACVWLFSHYQQKKEVQNFALSNHQTTAFECTIPNVQSNRFCVCGQMSCTHCIHVCENGLHVLTEQNCPRLGFTLAMKGFLMCYDCRLNQIIMDIQFNFLPACHAGYPPTSIMFSMFQTQQQLGHACYSLCPQCKVDLCAVCIKYMNWKRTQWSVYYLCVHVLLQSEGITPAQSVYGTLIAGAVKQRQFSSLIQLVKV